MTIQPEILKHIKSDVTPISFVWAQDSQGGIGYQGDLPWDLPGDMKFFKEVTWDEVVVMGRKTYESIPHPPLKNRVNMILTRNEDYQQPGALVFNNPELLLKTALSCKKPIHIIGGSSLFSIYQDKVNVLFCTRISHEFPADVFMPSIDLEQFKLVDSRQGVRDEHNKYDYVIETHIRKDILLNCEDES